MVDKLHVPVRRDLLESDYRPPLPPAEPAPARPSPWPTQPKLPRPGAGPVAAVDGSAADRAVAEAAGSGCCLSASRLLHAEADRDTAWPRTSARRTDSPALQPNPAARLRAPLDGKRHGTVVSGNTSSLDPAPD